MKTKEEILSLKLIPPIKTRTPKMSKEEYAKHQVVEFDKWMLQNKYERSYANPEWYSNHPPEAGRQTFFTYEELYNRFIKSQNKK